MKYLLILAILLTGCATVPKASPDQDRTAKQFAPPDGKANLYIARSGDSFGAMITFDLAVDGKVVTHLSAGTYFVVSVDPGKHTVTAIARENQSSGTVDAQAGKNYYWELTAKPGLLSAQASLSPVLLEPMGRLMIQQYPMAAPLP